jgi:hypothetical protein
MNGRSVSREAKRRGAQPLALALANLGKALAAVGNAAAAVEKASEPLTAVFRSVSERERRRAEAGERAAREGTETSAIQRAIAQARWLELDIARYRLDLTDPDASEADRESALKVITSLHYAARRCMHGIDGDSEPIFNLIAGINVAAEICFGTSDGACAMRALHSLPGAMLGESSLVDVMQFIASPPSALSDEQIATIALHGLAREWPEAVARLDAAEVAAAVRLWPRRRGDRRDAGRSKWQAICDLARNAGLDRLKDCRAAVSRHCGSGTGRTADRSPAHAHVRMIPSRRRV